MNRIAIDLDDKESIRDFKSRFKKYSRLLPPVREVIVEESEKGWHVLFLTADHDPRLNLALRLLLLDDIKHVMYDIEAVVHNLHFPTNVLFTEKRYASRRYVPVFRGSLEDFRRWLDGQVQ